MNQRKNFITPEKAAWFIPFFISSGISILLIIFFVIPQYLKSNQVNSELKELVKKKSELNNLKLQYEIINKKFAKLNKEKLKIIELITGRSNLETLLAKLGEIGAKHNIEFKTIAPKKITKFDKVQKSNNNNNGNIPLDPLLVQGTKKYTINFTFESNFINLLSFLRELEFQDNVILFNDINLKKIKQNNKEADPDNPLEKLQVRLTMTFYGKG